MKNKIKCIIYLLFVFIISGCSCTFTINKDINRMSLIELNIYNKKLRKENDILNDTYKNYLSKSENIDVNKVIEIINHVSTEVVKSNVMITSEAKSFFHSTSVSSGSGTIIKDDGGYYYILTNNHVIYALGNKTSYYVYDYLNNEYNATLLFHDSNYDLALLRIKKRVDLRVTSLAINDIEIDKQIIVIGQPQGQRNAITFGKSIKYERVSCSDCNPYQSNINYDCLFYDARTTNGNSGGMILNDEFELVGVVTYGLTDEGGRYLYGAGSPINKVREFLVNNNFEVGDDNA